MNNPLDAQVTGFRLGGDEDEGEEEEEEEDGEEDNKKRKTVSRGLHNIADDLLAGQERTRRAGRLCSPEV